MSKKEEKEARELLRKYGWNLVSTQPYLEIHHKDGSTYGQAFQRGAEILIEYYAAIDDVTTNKLPKWRPGTEEAVKEEFEKGIIKVDFSKLDETNLERFARMLNELKSTPIPIYQPANYLAEKAVFTPTEVEMIVNYIWRNSDEGFRLETNHAVAKYEYFKEFVPDGAFSNKDRMRKALLEMVFMIPNKS